MEIFMPNIPYSLDQSDLTRIVANELHQNIYFSNFMAGAPLNFKVLLFPDRRRQRFGHSGKGVLILPSREVGEAFLRLFGTRGLSAFGRRIVCQKSKNEPRKNILDEIQRMPYRNPEVICEEQARFTHFANTIHLKDVEFAWECRDQTLSIEWQWNNPDDAGESMNSFDLEFHEKDREIVIEGKIKSSPYGPEAFEELIMSLAGAPQECKLIKIRYSQIKAIEIDSGEKTIVFFLNSPPSLEKPILPLFSIGNSFESDEKRDRLTHLGGTHRHVMPFAWTVIRFSCSSQVDLEEFKSMADFANLPLQDGHRYVKRLNLFSFSNLLNVLNRFTDLEYFVAFQCESILRDLLLDPIELVGILPRIQSLVTEHGPKRTTNILRRFGLILRDNMWLDYEDTTSIDECLDQAIEETQYAGLFTYEDEGLFNCLHVTFTPTAMKLRGPFPDMSNRILRRYSGNPEAFLRVSFTDEDGLKFRFNHKVNGADFIKTRVGTILNNGFEVCGRKFEFLAYSQSALKQYTVWFVSPFTDKSGRRITSQSIRDGIGSNWDPELLRCPARFAARVSQAFTATNTSTTIEPDYIYHIPDIERNNYCFSDGCGLASPDMFKNILETRRQGTRNRTTSVVQIRIQGAKGVISEVPYLDGFQLLLRPSMVKFDATHHHAVEIARFFDKPTRFFLNRFLITILNGLGVLEAVFLKLQGDAVEETRNATKSLQGAANLVEIYGMGRAFAFPSILINLKKLGLEVEKTNPSAVLLKDPFLNRCFDFAVHHVLREIKYRARIPVPEAWKLVGIVDEYNFLKPNQIYACVNQEAGNCKYIKGPIMISKSPTIHPGDVQIVEAIGEPPVDCLLRKLVNCVVFSQQGDRPLPNQLSGSDLDGDEYDLVAFASLHPPRDKLYKPGEYPPVPRRMVENTCTISDVADFVVDFINNDMLGIIATDFLQIADRYGLFHEDCLKLAELHSWAVDFPKNGSPVPRDKLPHPPRSIKPDWAAPEIITDPSLTNFYKSQSILGKLFRDIELSPLPEIGKDSRPRRRRNRRNDGEQSLESTLQSLSLADSDPISTLLHGKLTRLVDLREDDNMFSVVSDIFEYFIGELKQISYAYSTSRHATARLREEEVFVGTIIANTTQQDNMAKMREETSALTKRILKEFEGDKDSPIGDWVNRSWMAWSISIRNTNTHVFGAKSFGFLALRSLFDASEKLEQYD